MSRWADELEIYDWAKVGCACGRGGASLAQGIRWFLDQPVAGPGGPSLINDVIEGHAVIQSNVYESAVPTSRVLSLAVSESAEIDRRMDIYHALLTILSCDSQAPEFEGDWPPIVTESRSIVEAVKEVIYADLAETKHTMLLNVLEHCESDERRLREVYEQILPGLPALYRDGYRLFARRDEGW